jgi:ABC-type transporter Mla subunit MlaD
MVAATSSVEDLTRDLGNEMRKTAGIAIAHADRNTQQVNQLSSALRTTSDKMATTVDQATNTMQNNIGQSTQALSQVSYSLQATARQLDKTASLLSSAQPRSFRDFLFGKQPRQP